ncbi:hypothetical protein [Solemya velum gill symbiont]|uniref:hypothetical protein n=1 Tax=Solemya velum gill symbiont TaxID=2340 RepID=UPI000996A5AA|nr:hypothetical protein [Solemya velum gill symbiont]OOY51420.1 hypothetical protein BOV94_05395 [Solemya velum gill symbiont]OOY72515.1 hypothetical protein BOW08_05540 [Solemya velum gill symbiont]OOY84074.1 hypothetical protein BOW13_09770 [Solemya velum gill symbiont]OOY99364.1 hypothetical protein BOW19_04460 [Solemya velum gill symbiont]OOZ27391.1 hypothetical protein BOW32_04625 [Solemya velum gill symbiont]
MKAQLEIIKRWLTPSGPKSARSLFKSAGLPFPTIPEPLAAKLEHRDKWLFSTRKIEVPPYFLQQYAEEFESGQVTDYVILSHDGHGINSYAIQYYLVQQGLGLFLHLKWGGVYTNNEKAVADISAAFDVADRIVAWIESMRDDLKHPVQIVASDFYGCYWMIGGEKQDEWDAWENTPLKALNAILESLQSKK